MKKKIYSLVIATAVWLIGCASTGQGAPAPLWSGLALNVSYYDLGLDSEKKPMYARVYGSGTETAVFFIGGIHGNEFSGIWSIHLMEQYIEQNQQLIPSSSRIFFLNPVHDLRQIERAAEEKELKNDRYRKINGTDPNRDFIDKVLPETRNIIGFTEFLCKNYGTVIIISAHGANDEKQDRNAGEGVVFPKYILTPSGKQKAEENRGNYKNGLSLSKNDYYNPQKSVDLANMFGTFTKYKYIPLWESKIYEGEYMEYISRLEKDIILIEFEAPMSFSHNKIEEVFGKAYIDFINSLFWEKL